MFTHPVLLSLALTFIILFGVALAQGWLLRRQIPTLPPPSGTPSGTVGNGPCEMRLLVVGESSAVGVGVRSYDETLAAHAASIYSSRTGCKVHWSAVGQSGATLDELIELLAKQPFDVLKADVVVIAIGVNDVLRLRSPWRWRHSLRLLLDVLEVSTGSRTMLLSPVPPLWKFTMLPAPLRYLLGAEAFMIDLVSRLVVTRDRRARHLSIPLLDPETMLCEGDRFHPSSYGYREWARHVTLAMPAEQAGSSCDRPEHNLEHQSRASI